MRNRNLLLLIINGLNLEGFQAGHLRIVDENRVRTGDTLLVKSHIAGEVSYHFGNVYFAIVQTVSGWKVGATVLNQDLPLEINWQEFPKILFKDSQSFDTPLIHALREIDLYPLGDNEPLADETVYCKLYVHTPRYYISLVIEESTQNEQNSQIWIDLLKTMRQIFSLYDTKEATQFLATNAMYFPKQ